MKFNIFIGLLCLLFISFTSSQSYAQSNKKYVKLSSSKKDKVSIIWMTTSVKADNKVKLKAKMFSSFEVETRHIKLLIDGEEESSKAGFGSLFGNAEKEFTFEREIDLENLETKFQVKVVKDSLEFLSSELEIKDNKVRILSDDDFTSRILWTFPDPAKTEGHKFRSESSLFHYTALVKTGVNLNSKSSVKIILNKAIKDPKASDKLVKVGDNLYEYTGSLLLDGSMEENEIFLRLIVNDEKIDSKPYFVSVDEDQPSLYLLSIGTLTNLEYTAKDARDFAEMYENSQSANAGLFQNISIDLLSGIDATTNEIKGRIEELNIKKEQGIIKPQDLIILFVSSHGFVHDGKLRIQGDDYDPSRKKTTSVSFNEDIMSTLDDINCKKLVFVDACHSGAGSKFNVADLNYEIEKLNQVRTGITTFVSSQGDELSYEDVSWKNGAFTEAIIKGLQGAEADIDQNFIITVNELSAYLTKEVPRMVMDKKGKPQNPKLLTNDLGDVAIYFIN